MNGNIGWRGLTQRSSDQWILAGRRHFTSEFLSLAQPNKRIALRCASILHDR
jgi:hypothetical protein